MTTVEAIAETGRRESAKSWTPSRWLAGRPGWTCAAVFLLTLGIRAALLPWLHVPKPAIHDEFSYLLAADTYASGRLANPPHPFWEHFETFHVLTQPTYASKYPPLQGLVLAFGQKLFGQPWIGVLLSTALMCAAICWMLQGWITPGAALLGALLVMLRLAILGYWMNSYWGGAVPAIGGALVFGALARIALGGQVAHGVTLGVGLAVLMTSRPYDGLVLGLISVAVLVWSLGKKRLSARACFRAALPAVAILAIAAGAMAYNNYRVTGSAVTLPYQVHERQYSMTSVFAWPEIRPEPVYHHAVMRKYWAEWQVDATKAVKSDLANAFLSRLSVLYDFFFGLWPLLIPPLIWPYALKTSEERLAALLLAVSLVAVVGPFSGILPHYAASITGLIYLRFLQTLTRLGAWRPSGRPLGFAIATFLVTLLVYQFCADTYKLFRFGEYVAPLARARDEIVHKLERQPGRHLVLVRYSPHHDVHQEWVYNGAAIDAAPIVWAREMGLEQDRPFIEYFQDRQVWLLEPDQAPPRLVPYTSAIAATGITR